MLIYEALKDTLSHLVGLRVRGIYLFMNQKKPLKKIEWLLIHVCTVIFGEAIVQTNKHISVCTKIWKNSKIIGKLIPAH